MKKLIILLLSLSFSTFAAQELTVHVSGSMSVARNWMEYTQSEELNIQKLLELLARSQTGAELIEKATLKAQSSGKRITEVIRAGEGSLTDTTLVRKFSPDTPDQVEFETRFMVYINKTLKWDDALLDLAHELTHFVYRDGFNPYADNFNAKDFIKSTIEGKGGEAQAFIMECKVLSELFKSGSQARSHCHSIKDEEGRVSLAKTVELFYHVGAYFETFHKQLTSRQMLSDFTQVKGSKINFVSSAYGLPYPVAALMEFDLVMSKVCENDRKRLAYYVSDTGRGPASENTRNTQFIQSYNSRCK